MDLSQKFTVKFLYRATMSLIFVSTPEDDDMAGYLPGCRSLYQLLCLTFYALPAYPGYAWLKILLAYPVIPG